MAKRSKKLVLTKDRALLRAIGQKIRKFREQRKLMVYDLTGDDMPIRSRQHWQKIEAGNKNFNIATLFKIAKTLNVSPEEILKGISF